jgi:hypothetical protein
MGQEHLINIPAMGEPGEYHIVHGEESVDRKDLLMTNCTLAGLLQYAQKRKAFILSLKPENDDGAYVEVDVNDGEVTLLLREHGGSKDVGGVYKPDTEVQGKVGFTKDHELVKSFLAKKYDLPRAMAWDLRKALHLFADRQSYDSIVKKLGEMNFKVSTILEDTLKDNGQKKKLLEQSIENHEAVEFPFHYRMVHGYEKQSVDVMVLFEVKGTNVELQLFSPTLLTQERDIKEALVNSAVAAMKTELGDTIPFIEVN